jgi:hypothetical protein
MHGTVTLFRAILDNAYPPLNPVLFTGFVEPIHLNTSFGYHYFTLQDQAQTVKQNLQSHFCKIIPFTADEDW